MTCQASVLIYSFSNAEYKNTILAIRLCLARVLDVCADTITFHAISTVPFFANFNGPDLSPLQPHQSTTENIVDANAG